jgi:hypothetical protein
MQQGRRPASSRWQKSSGCSRTILVRSSTCCSCSCRETCAFCVFETTVSFTACCQTTAAPSSLISTRKDRNSKTKEYYWDIPYMGMLILLFRIIQKARKSNQCDMATWRFSIASRTGVQRGVTVNQKWRSLIWYCRKNGQIIGPPRMMCDVTMWRCDAMISLVKVARLCWQSTPQF